MNSSRGIVEEIDSLRMTIILSLTMTLKSNYSEVIEQLDDVGEVTLHTGGIKSYHEDQRLNVSQIEVFSGLFSVVGICLVDICQVDGTQDTSTV